MKLKWSRTPDVDLQVDAPKNPFDWKEGVLKGQKGETVPSGPFQEKALKQKFYKVTISSDAEGVEPLDPDIIGHDG